MYTDLASIPSPCFVLDSRLLNKNLTLMNHVQQEAGIDIILAFKGFAMWSAFPQVRNVLKGATASSLFEAKLCFEEMKTKAHTYCVAYNEDEFDRIAEISSHITFNSISQMLFFEEKAKKWLGKVSFGLRVNPEKSDVTTDLYNPSSPTSRLGVTKKNMPDTLPQWIEGLHFHVLCESTSYALEEVLQTFETNFSPYFHQLKWMNMGGGHLMTRKDYNSEHLIALLKNFKQKHQKQILLEPGSAVAWQTGFLKTTVIDIVENGDVKTAIINASFTCHMPDCLEMPYKPVITGADKNADNQPYAYRIGGVSCLAGDFMDAYGFDHPLQIGDTLIFEDMIHYTMVKTTMFNGVKHPSIGIIREDGNFDLIKTFDYSDFKNRLS